MHGQDRGAALSQASGDRGGRSSRSERVDGRADGQVRFVSLSRDVVRIDRTVEGIAMRVAVPVRSYHGVALTLRPDRDGHYAYRVDLLHRDQDLSVVLDEAADDQDILADWRLWSRFFRLPALVERRAGAVEPAEAGLGSVLLGSRDTERRGGRAHAKHRPRFLRRRKTGIPAAVATLHRGERELVARS